MTLEELVVSLGLDAGEFEKGIQEAQSAAQSGGQKIADNIVSPLKTAFAGLIAGFGFKSMLDTYTAQADQVGKFADSIGANVEAVQAWGEATARAGGSAAGFQASLRSLNSNLAIMAETGKSRAAPILEAMGIKATDATGKMKDSFDILGELASKAETMGKAQFMGLAQRLGLDQGTIMLLQNGRKSVEELVQRQKELGVYSKEDTEIAAKYNDAIADMQQVLTSMSGLVMRMVVPALSAFVNGFTDVVSFLRKHETFMQTFFAIIGAVMTAKAIPALLQFGKAAALAMRPFLPLIAIVTALALIIDDLIVYMEGGESELAEFWSIFGTGPEIAAALKQAWEDLKQAGKALFQSLITIAKTFFSYFSGAIEPLKNIFKSLFQLIKAIANKDGQGIVDAILGILDNLTAFIGQILLGWLKLFGDIFSAIFTAIGNKLRDIGASIEAWAIEAEQKLSAAWEAIKQAVAEAWDAVKQKISAAWNAIVNVVTSMASSVQKTMQSAWNSAKNAVKAAWDGIVNTATNAINSVITAVTNFGTSVLSSMQKAWNDAKNAASTAWDGITTLVSNAVNSVINTVTNFGSSILTAMQNAWNGAKNAADAVLVTFLGAVTKTWDDIVGSISSFGTNLLSGVQSAWKAVVDFFNGLNLFESGSKLLTTFIDGVKSKIKAVTDAVSSAFKSVRDLMPFSDAKTGPLSQLTESGSKLLTTFGEGVEKGEGSLLDKVSDVFSAVKEEMSALTGGKSEEKSEQPAMATAQRAEVPASDVQMPPVVLVPDVQAQTVNIPAPDVISSPVNVPAPDVKMEAVNVPAPDVHAQSVNVPSVKVPAPDIISSPVNVSAPDVAIPSVNVPAPDVISSAVKVPAPDVQIPPVGVQAPESMLGSMFDGLMSAVAPLKDGLLELFAPVKDGLTNVFSSSVALLKDAAGAMMPGPELALAGVAPSITETNSQQTNTTTVSTNIGAVNVQTQATDAQGIAASLPAAMKGAFQRAGTNASLSGVRQ